MPEPRGLPGSGRVEAFSDGVFAIAVTLLVLDLHTDFDRGSFGHQLLEQWPGYVAYLAGFFNIAGIWINHHELFGRIARVDVRLNCLNLALLLVASLFPFAVAVVSASHAGGDRGDQIAASVVYAGIGFCVPLAFIAIYSYLAGAPDLFVEATHVSYALVARRRALVSVVVYPVTAGLAFLSPNLTLALFVSVPVFFIAAVFFQQRPDTARRSLRPLRGRRL